MCVYIYMKWGYPKNHPAIVAPAPPSHHRHRRRKLEPTAPKRGHAGKIWMEKWLLDGWLILSNELQMVDG